MSELDTFERYRRLDLLIREGKFLDEATDEAVWLWQHMLESAPAMYGVRHSFFIARLAALIAIHPAARQRFSQLRDASNERARDPGVAREALADWFSLNKALNEEQVTLRWLDRALGEAARLPVLRQFQMVLFPLLLTQGRWSDAGRLVVNPVARLDQLWTTLNRDSEEPDDVKLAAAHRVFQKIAAETCAALEAASRRDEALDLERRAIDLDGSQDMKDALAEARRLAAEGQPVASLF